MNVADSEVVAAILQTTDAELTERWEDADIILLNTCSIRDNAEQKVGSRLRELKAHIKGGRWKVESGKWKADHRCHRMHGGANGAGVD